ncbi:MAG TPA: hypothetical protein DCW90_20955 [Lachnospiraceae bacterium]|nr:hypothetical protein [Lachnospiraceae bacterium]
MRRTTKKERKENANRFYNMFMNSNCNQAAIVVERVESSNPNINRCKFIAVSSTLAFMESSIVIAESVSGITGCFMELLDDIKPGKGTEKIYFDDGFNDWLEETYKFRITYRDGLVFMLEKNIEKHSK